MGGRFGGVASQRIHDLHRLTEIDLVGCHRRCPGGHHGAFGAQKDEAVVLVVEQHPAQIGGMLLNDKHYGFVFLGAKGTVMTTWAATMATDKVDFGQPVQIVDPLTGNATESATHALTIAPILVAGVPDKLVQQARDNKARPFPWGGDYTGAKSVSVTMGDKNVAKGLHTKSAD